MTLTCKPVLIAHPALPRARLRKLFLPTLAEALDDFRISQAGRPVAIKMTVVHFEDVMFAQSSASLMLSQGGDQAFKEITSREALARPELHEAMDILIHTPSLIQDLQDLNWDKYGWQTSGEGFGYNIRELWIFSRAALVLNNVHSCYIEDVKELASQSLVMHEPPASKHDQLALTQYINDLLHRTSSLAIPDEVDRWPEGIPQDHIPFSEIKPDDLLARARSF